MYFFNEEKIDTNKAFVIGIECRNLLSSGLTSGSSTYELLYTWYGVQPEIRFYRVAPRKFYFGLFSPLMLVKLQYYENEKLEQTERGSFIGVAGRIGYKFGKKILFEPSIYAGIGSKRTTLPCDSAARKLTL